MTKQEQMKRILVFIRFHTDMQNLDRISHIDLDRLVAFILQSLYNENPALAVSASEELNFTRTKKTYVNNLNRRS
jgi:hypothetical protein